MCAFLLYYQKGGNILEKYMLEAIKEAKKSLKSGDVPVGAVIVENGKIISRGHNKKEKTHKATSHAEIEAINKACKKKKNWYLNECTLYTTVEPCLMCTGAILQARISKVVYGTSNQDFGYLSKLEKKKIEVVPNVLKEECTEILSQFFQNKRK